MERHDECECECEYVSINVKRCGATDYLGYVRARARVHRGLHVPRYVYDLRGTRGRYYRYPRYEYETSKILVSGGKMEHEYRLAAAARGATTGFRRAYRVPTAYCDGKAASIVHWRLASTSARRNNEAEIVSCDIRSDKSTDRLTDR